jgi:hypothetical protein
MSDHYFRRILGVPPGATREEIRVAWRRRVMENHPDRFPGEQKALQELAMITLTEAYNALMAAVPEAPGSASRDGKSPPRRRPARSPAAGPTRPAAGPSSPPHTSTSLGVHGDPAYAYYKQGFVNFSLAIHGVAEINRRLAAGRVRRTYPRRYTAAEDIRSSLAYLSAAHGYFSRVTSEHAESVWASDSRMKLRRIENFTEIYRRILANLGAG